MFVFQLICGALMGAALGSFASASAWAWLHGQPIWHKRSVCGHCQKKLPVSCLIPVFSYLALRGKCAFCGGRIPAFHFWIEFASALAGCLIAAIYGFSWLAIVYIPLAVALITASATDISAQLLPDLISFGGLALLPALLLIRPDPDLQSVIIGYIAGGGIPLLLHFFFRLLRGRECLGLGDIKLYALGGALSGWQALPCLFFFSALAGICAFIVIMIFVKGAGNEKLWNKPLPFGPFICLAIMSILLFPCLPEKFYVLSWTM